MAQQTKTTLPEKWDEMKRKHPDAMLMFHCGDFYELYNEDAKKGAEVLGITLTKRNDITMAGFPAHALDTYLPRLIRAGLRVAICDPLDEPKPKIKKRGVTEIEDKQTETAEADIAKENKTEKAKETAQEVDLDEDLKPICDLCVKMHEGFDELLRRLHTDYLRKQEAYAGDSYNSNALRDVSKVARDIAWLTDMQAHIVAIDSELTDYYIG